MNVKIIDGWSILHFLFSFLIAYLLIEYSIPIFIVFLLIVFFELLEHSFVGDLVFKWTEKERKERFLNSFMDIIIGIFGTLMAYLLWL